MSTIRRGTRAQPTVNSPPGVRIEFGGTLPGAQSDRRDGWGKPAEPARTPAPAAAWPSGPQAARRILAQILRAMDLRSESWVTEVTP